MQLLGREGFRAGLGYHVASATELKCVADERGIWLPGVELSDEAKTDLGGFDPFGDGLVSLSQAETFGMHYVDNGEELTMEASSEGYMGYI